MKTLIKVLLPLTLASTLFVGCGDKPKLECTPKCGDAEICVKGDSGNMCANKCGDDNKCTAASGGAKTDCLQDKSEDKTPYCAK